MTDAYEVVTWRGKWFDRMTVQAIEAAEKGYGGKFAILQGSYNGGTGKVSASAGTHDGGGAVDVAPTKNPAAVVRALRSVGFAAWHRLPSEGPWVEHVHAILIGNARVSASAARQVAAYRVGRNGLVSNKVDPTWRPNPIKPYVYRPPHVSRSTQVRRMFVEVLDHPTTQGIPKTRTVVWGLLRTIRVLVNRIPD